MNKVHTIIEPEPPPPSHLSDTTIAIEPEPPDCKHPLHTPADTDEQQWIDDAKHHAITSIKALRDHNEILNSGIAYSPLVHKIQVHNTLNKRLLQAQRRVAQISKLPPPQVHRIHIPTPKSSRDHYHHPSIIHDTTWKDYECNDWIRNSTGGWAIPPPNTHETDDITPHLPKACSIDSLPPGFV